MGIFEIEATADEVAPSELPLLLFLLLLPPLPVPPLLLVADAISVLQLLVEEPTIVVRTHDPTTIAPIVGVGEL